MGVNSLMTIIGGTSVMIKGLSVHGLQLQGVLLV